MTKMQTPSIEIDNLAIGYGKTIVAQGLYAKVLDRQLVCLVGENGAGKSTFLKTIAGFQKPLSGNLRLQGRDVSTVPHGERSRLLSVSAVLPIRVSGDPCRRPTRPSLMQRLVW